MMGWGWTACPEEGFFVAQDSPKFQPYFTGRQVKEIDKAASGAK
jgi:hypothetical protein